MMTQKNIVHFSVVVLNGQCPLNNTSIIKYKFKFFLQFLRI